MSGAHYFPLKATRRFFQERNINMIQLLFIAICMGTYADVYTDTYADVYNEFSFDYSMIVENEKTTGLNLIVEYETRAHLESNDFINYLVLDDTTIGRYETSFSIENENIINYKLIKYDIIPELAYITWNNDFITVGFDFTISFALSSTDPDYETISFAETLSNEYNYEYVGGAWGGQDIDLITASYTTLTGNIYLDDSSPEYLSGYNAGYNAGVLESSAEHPIFKIFNAVFGVIDNVLQVEILPGIRLWYLLGVPLFFLILQFVLNLFR